MGGSLGFNIRVFCDLLWTKDRTGFLRRMEEFLKIAGKHKIGVMFVLFDSVWDPHPYWGRQREPTPHLHNSGWVQGPGAEILQDPQRFEKLQRRSGRNSKIRKRPQNPRLGSMERARQHQRQQLPCLEVPAKSDKVAVYLKKVFDWAREVVHSGRSLESGLESGTIRQSEAVGARSGG